MSSWKHFGLCVVLVAATAELANAQEMNPTATAPPSPTAPQGPSEYREGIPVYKIQVVARDIPAINYFHRQGATKIGFEGTDLLPAAKGEGRVEAAPGRTTITLHLQGLTPANGFGPEYLTYVLWAISPEGRPVNLGEVLPTGSKDKNDITVTTNMQAFGLIVTAEPYFAVTMPSDLVVMQNAVADKTQGVIEQVNAHYTLLPRGAYAETAGRHAVLHPITRDERSPLELYEAENAIQIADAAGAEQYAGDTMVNAKTALQNAEGLNTQKGDRKQTITYAREAVQGAEDARLITIRKIKAEDEAAQLKARQDAEKSAQESQLAAQQSQLDAQKAQAAAEQQAAQRAQAEAAAAEAEARAQKARAEQQAAEQAAQQATQQTEQIRERLKQQLNQVLQTTESARGLIVNMSDVLFDFNKYTLKPEAREKLAKVSGILLAYPGLKLQVEGYTDNIGTDDYNQKLSEERADSVRTYLVTESVPDTNITAAGYGKTNPIADNATNAGRAQNRRVQLVVSGSAIGVGESAPGAQSNGVPSPPTTPAPQNNQGISNPQQ
ncbi:MAG TPA: OmpA family protein [Terracidiphilus sp.]|jgi:outer membrane protein OmpA-like peptidoglycan-associated protein|nr:OmpA family protein [Terracidiphilus sp.]